MVQGKKFSTLPWCCRSFVQKIDNSSSLIFSFLHKFYFSTISRLLNTPQVSFAEQNQNSQALKSQVSLSGEQNWEQTLNHFDHQQKSSTGNVHNNGNAQTVGSDLENALGRADTLDRIPVFVNPHDLNQTCLASHGNQDTAMNNTHDNPSSNFNELQVIKQDDSTATTHALTQSHQSQITLSNTSTQQVWHFEVISDILLTL